MNADAMNTKLLVDKLVTLVAERAGCAYRATGAGLAWRLDARDRPLKELLAEVRSLKAELLERGVRVRSCSREFVTLEPADYR